MTQIDLTNMPPRSSRSTSGQAARKSPTPPVVVSPADNAPSPATRQSPGVGITSNMSRLRLETTPPPDCPRSGGLNTFSAMAAAIDDASQSNLPATPPASTPGPAATTPSPGEQRRNVLTPPSGARRRRSSSRVDQPPYDVRDEEPPEDRFHTPAFQAAFRDAKELVADLQTALASSGLHLEEGSTIRRLDEKARSLAQFRCPSTRVVGFVGDSGTGKSSLLNSLLDFQDLARTSNGGAACTCVATEYHYHESADTFVVEVELFGPDEIKTQQADMLQDFRHFCFHGEAMEIEERKVSAARSDIARHTLEAMFRPQLRNNMKFLTENSSESVLSSMREWTGQAGLEDLQARRVLSTLEECSDYLMRLTSEPASRQDKVTWPYINNIKVFLNSNILSKGLILVDLPGLRDMNTARRNITERYILKCNEIFAISAIGRAATDEGVKSVVTLAKRAGLSNIGIVCTKSDDIKADEAMKDWANKEGTRIGDLHDQVTSYNDQLLEILREIDDYNDDDSNDDNLSPEEREYDRQLRRKESRARKNLIEAEFRLKKYLVETRNAKITHDIQGIYRDEVPAGRLNVFCVSNSDYWLKRKEPRDASADLIDLSGIPYLRKHCISIVSEAQLQSATRYIAHDIPSLVSEVELWVQSGAPSLDMERRQAVIDTLNAIEARLRQDLLNPTSQVRDASRLINPGLLFFEGNVTRWAAAARGAAAEWAGWHHSTYAAFCRQFGDYYTQAAGRHNWNEELIHSMISDMDRPRDLLASRIERSREITADLAEQTMEWAEEHLMSEIQGHPELIDSLGDAIQSRQNLMTDRTDEIFDDFGKNVSALETDAFTGIQTSFIAKAMEDTYRACNQESGRGSDARRKGNMRQRVAQPALIQDLTTHTARQLRNYTRVLQQQLNAEVSAQLSGLIATFDIVRNENAAAEGGRDRALWQRVGDAVAESRARWEGLHSVVAQ